MTRRFAPTTLVIVVATLFALGIPPRAQAGERAQRECSNASLQGQLRIHQHRNAPRPAARFGRPFR